MFPGVETSGTVYSKHKPIAMGDANMTDSADGSSSQRAKGSPVVYDEQRRDELARKLQREKDKLSQLPRGSSYAAHRSRVVIRALELLAKQKEAATTDEESELLRLLQSLSL